MRLWFLIAAMMGKVVDAGQTPLLRAVLAFLHPWNGLILVLLSSSLMPRVETTKARPSASSARCERCPHCNRTLPDEWIKAAHSRVAGRTGGRPRILRPCPFCKGEFGARELRKHMPVCEKNPTFGHR